MSKDKEEGNSLLEFIGNILELIGDLLELICDFGK